MMIVLVVVSSLAWAAPSTSDRIEIKSVIGPQQVSVMHRKGKEEMLLPGATLAVGDEVRTVAKQVVVIEAYDKSQWKIAPQSAFKIEGRYPENKNLSYWAFSMLTGSMWGKVTPREEKVAASSPEKDKGEVADFKLKVKSKTAALGIRGTEYLMQATEDLSEIDVLEGTVWWGTSDKFAPGTYVEVKTGEHSEVRRNEVVKPSPTTQKGEALLEKYRLAIKDTALSDQAQRDGRTAEECRYEGLGWRARKDGRGECFKAPLEE